MTDRTAPSSDARKRNAARGVTFAEAADLIKARMPRSLATPDQENPMSKTDRHDELVALLTEIRDRLPEPEGVKDEPEKTHPCPGCGTFTDKRVCNSCWGTSDDPEAGYSQAEAEREEPAPADDLPGEPDDRCPHDIYDRGDGTVSECSLPKGHAPTAHDSGDGVMWTDGEHWKDEESNLDDLPGEPVEPGDLRAGDRVAFTWLSGERMTCTLVEHSHLGGVLHSDVTDASGVHRPNLTSGDLWATGISDVRLLERAPREGEDRDEALARVIFGDAYGSHEGLRLAQLDVALMAREHIEAEEAENHPVGCGQMIRDVRDGDGFVTTIDGVMIAKTDSWNDLTERAKKAEAEAKHLRERLDALRADLSPGGLVWAVDAALARDDERAAKGGSDDR